MARGLAAASVCALLTYCGHLVAGGVAPDLGLLAVLGLLLAGFLITLADRRRGPLAIVILVGGSQLALHELLQLLGGSHLAHAGPSGSPLTGTAAHVGAHPLLMLGAHAVATVITSAMLAGAEDAVFTVAAALARAVPLVITAAPATRPPGPTIPVTGPLDHRLRDVLCRRLHLRRGPPLGRLAAVGL